MKIWKHIKSFHPFFFLKKKFDFKMANIVDSRQILCLITKLFRLKKMKKKRNIYIKHDPKWSCLSFNFLERVLDINGSPCNVWSLNILDSYPTLVYRFISQTLQPGPTVSLKCIASGNPAPNIVWFRDNLQLHPSQR